MRRVCILLLLCLLLLIPTSAAFAQLDDDNSTFYDCNPYTALNNLLVTATFITDLPSIERALVYAGEYLINCGETWFTMILDGSFFIQTDNVIPPGGAVFGMENDFGNFGLIMNADTLEYAFGLLLNERDVWGANSYFCESDKVDEEALAFLDTVTIKSLDCTDKTDGSISCRIEIVTNEAGQDPVTTIETNTFLVQGDVFCSVN